MFEPRLDITRLHKEVAWLEQWPVETGKILLYGSSGFGRWTDKTYKAEEFCNHEPIEKSIRNSDGSLAIVNNAFGGSTAEELLYYYHRLVKPYKPKALCVMVYLNDSSFGYTPFEVMFLYERLFEWARKDFPGIKIYAFDIHPICLKKMNEQTTWASLAKEFNQRLKEYCDKHEDTIYVEHCADPCWYDDPADVGDFDKVPTRLFIEDGVHFTPEGYDRYEVFMRNVLKDELE